MPLPPYNASEDERGPSSALAKGFLVLSAIGSWGLLGVACLTSTTPVPVAPLCVALAGVLSFAGSMACLFGIRRERMKSEPWLRWCALANYLALAAVVSVLLLESCGNKY